VQLASIPCPVLSVIGERDNLVPPAATAPFAEALGREPETLRVPAGHAGLFVGRQAKKHGIPAILQWLGAPDRAGSEKDE
jgi:polyhydroxyalkanoate synthase